MNAFFVRTLTTSLLTGCPNLNVYCWLILTLDSCFSPSCKQRQLFPPNAIRSSFYVKNQRIPSNKLPIVKLNIRLRKSCNFSIPVFHPDLTYNVKTIKEQMQVTRNENRVGLQVIKVIPARTVWCCTPYYSVVKGCYRRHKISRGLLIYYKSSTANPFLRTMYESIYLLR